MSLQIAAGAKSLLSMGVSLGDLAIVFRHARSVGNWLRAAGLDAELFESIMEDQNALLRRHGLVDVVLMKKRWSQLDFIYEGSARNSSSQSKTTEGQDLTEFSWLMVTIVTALDLALPTNRIRSLLVDVFAEVLEGDDGMKESLRVQIPNNINGWRSVGCVRGMVQPITVTIRKTISQRVIPQLNSAEQEEVKNVLVWLMADRGNDISIVSVGVYSIMEAIRKAGVFLSTDGKRRYEGEPMVRYVENDALFDAFKDPQELKDPFNAKRGLQTRAQQVSYPRGQPEAMIDALRLNRDVLNKMEEFWTRGSRAAEKVQLIPTSEATLPFGPESDIYYSLDERNDLSRNRFRGSISMIADHGFPATTQSILEALERLTQGLEPNRLEWLHMHTARDYLERETSKPSGSPEDMELWTQYQALVFGFHYKLLEPLISLEHLQQDVFFRGLWGHGSTSFLAMCSHFAKTLRDSRKISRTHVLYMLATMYDGRPKPYSQVTSGAGLVAVLGTISVLALPLLSPSDVPDKLARFAIVDLPVVDLMADSYELYSHRYCSIDFMHSAVQPKEIAPRGPAKKWSVHAKLGKLFGEGPNDVVMAARCDGRLVGWFGPLAADFTFLSSCYQGQRHGNEQDFEDDSIVNGFEIKDEQWQSCQVQRPVQQDRVDQIGVVHSRGSAILRYAATGFFANALEEIAIATDDVSVAVGRVGAQGAGIVIA